MPIGNQMFFQYPATDNMMNIIILHNHIMFFLVIILTTVLYLFSIIINRSVLLWQKPTKSFMNVYIKKYLTLNYLSHGVVLEIVWTVVPAIILIAIAIPSFNLLYLNDSCDDFEKMVNVKVTGHQWYWSYEVQNGDEFDSYMLPFSDLVIGDLRLGEVDNPLYLPTDVNLRFLVSSVDVLHSFAVPAFGIKIDAVPGRINAVLCKIVIPGTYFGQCSELCGVNHGFMPIKIIAYELDPIDVLRVHNVII